MKLLRSLLCAAAVLGLASCQTPAATTPDPLHQLIESGQLRVGLSATQPPFSMRDRKGELMGLDVDLAHALARAMGLEAVLVPMPFAELLTTLESKGIDLVISAMTITPERNVRVPFAGPYYVSGTATLSKIDDLSLVSDISKLDDPALRFAAVKGTTNESFARSYLSSATLITTTDFDAAVELVLKDEVDAVLADYPLCKVALMRHPDAGFSSLMTPFTIEPLGIAIRADAPRLVNLVDNYLDTLEYSGLLGQLKARWLGDERWLERLP